jgi:uncharacterized protein YndB with AHSA1/START domain
MTTWATLDDPGDGGAVLRFERVLAHPPEQVFRAISDPAELRHWFPAEVEWELRPGAPIRFAFGADDEETPGGEVLAVDPPRLLRFSWGDDVLAWELAPEGAGCRLVFTHALAPGGTSGGLRGAARNAAGWDTCLDALAARLDARPAPERGWLPRFEAYVERFGLAEAQASADGARFERDVVQPPEEVWALLVQDGAPVVGTPTPRRFGPAPPGPVEAVQPQRSLAYADDGGMRVRWSLERRWPGTLIAVDLAGRPAPTTLAAWQVHLELLVAALAGDERCWPEERVTALAERYRHFSAAGQAIR